VADILPNYVLPADMVFLCNCAPQCHGVPTEVSRATYYRHAPFRLSKQIQPVDTALVAAHFALVPDGEFCAEADDGDIIMDEVYFFIYSCSC
jgi:hypothetical protein